MPSLSFSKLIPGGNATIILTDPDIALENLPGISSLLMSPMHIQAEQVGALYNPGLAPALPGAGADLPHLQMMGGEFCVNATRSAALLLALRDGICHGVWKGLLTVSGMDRPVQVLVSSDLDALEAALPHADSANESPEDERRPRIYPPLPGTGASTAHSLYCAALVDCAAPGTGCRTMQPGVTLVSMPGIRHLLVDVSGHPLPDLHTPSWKYSSAAWRSAFGLAGSPTSGVVWYERQGAAYRIWPAVEVLATGSEHLESACGSASLAIALIHNSSERKVSCV